jgi:hypothetical protein
MTAYDAAWFASQVGKTPDWVRHHLHEIPHRRVGRSPRFTQKDLDDYLDSVAAGPRRMQTTGAKRKSA